MNEPTIRFVNRFSWRSAFIISAPSFIVLFSRLISGDFRPIIFIFLLGVIVLAGILGWAFGKDTLEIWNGEKCTRL
jgi:hypothetical protein